MVTNKTLMKFGFIMDENNSQLKKIFQNNLKLKDTKDNELFFDEKRYIMEVKSLYGLPLWFTKVLSQYKIYPTSFSKVGSIYKKERGIKVC